MEYFIVGQGNSANIEGYIVLVRGWYQPVYLKGGS
jgi:hypothetical protein